MTEKPSIPLEAPADQATFLSDFRRFFLRGLEALLPTLITIFVLAWLWGQLNDKLGQHILTGLRYLSQGIARQAGASEATSLWWVEAYEQHPFAMEALGVLLAITTVYIVGLFVGNLIGTTLWRLAELALMRIPLVRAIYPAVKQVTDFILADRRTRVQFRRVVAVQPHEKGIWSIGLVTGSGLSPLTEAVGQEMLTVFVPSSPTAFSGYVLVVPRDSVVELPLTVEEAMRLLVSGGVIGASAAELTGRQETAGTAAGPQDER